MNVIEVRDVHKTYPARQGARALLGRGGLGDWLRGARRENPEVLRGIDFTLAPGASLGIIGRNGCGKSTLLKILAGVTLPTRGEVRVHGRVASLLELGAGFHPMLTGRENVYLNAGLLGMRRPQVDAVFDAIVAFSGIGDFIDQPVDTYSSGMFVRIAFAVAVHANPDIFLVDEVLAVGDEAFQRQCRAKIGELREAGKTIVFVSHDLGLVHALCDQVVLLSQGRMIRRDTPQDTITYYLRQVGRESGVHTFTDGSLEAVFCHGRVSIFRGGRELTAPGGLQMLLLSLGQYHGSEEAEWTVTARHADGAEAEALLPRLPVRLRWRMRLEGGRLCWGLSCHCERPVDVEQIMATMAFPAAYRHYWYGAHEGAFPDILPGHHNPTAIFYPEPGCPHGALAGDPGADVPPVTVAYAGAHPNLGMHFQNGSYMMGSRIVVVAARQPAGSRLPEGDMDLADITLGLAHDGRSFEEWKDERRALASVVSGPATAWMRPGEIHLEHNGRPLSAAVHLHVQVRAQHLWTMGASLQWPQPHRADDALRNTGHSARLPYAITWEIAPAPGGFRLAVWMQCTAPLEVQEYNIALGLVAAYRDWATPDESGAFPDWAPEDTTWRHVNRDYAPQPWIEAHGDGLPALRLTAGAPAPFLMSALNTDQAQGARVLQALRVPAPGEPLRLDAGDHLLFRGTLQLDNGRTP
jgi:ABC-type polysaccharide/polyol phosphate transport system ATPase subunit